ncbi:MAG: DNA primase [Bacteroidetes bacterium]|nr:DNA primase [Bacteroidota bacterium]MBL6943224.1 DNA primase [Bacteroidales bacterium]
MEDSGITKEGVVSDIKKRILPSFVPHSGLLDKLLEKVEEIDIREISGVDHTGDVPIWQLVVISIDATMDLATKNSWNICRHNGFSYIYNGAYWYHLNDDEFMQFLGKVSHKLGVQLLRSRHFDFRKKLLSQFFAVADLPAPAGRTNSTLINLVNGTLELSPETVTLRSFCPGDFLKYQLPFRYDPMAAAPLFMRYLNRVLPHVELQNILSKYIGYVFIPSSLLKLEKTILLYGAGANGKSVFFDIINALLSRENVSNYSLAKLTDENGYYRAMIGNKLVNYASEINRKLDTAFFKQLVSGEPIEARLPYGQPFILENYAKFIFNTNELPRDVEHSNAYFRRFLIIPFDVIIPENEQDKSLAYKIIDKELPGVLNWVLEGLKRLTVNHKFTHSSLVENQIRQYKDEADTCFLFLEEFGYAPDINNTMPLKEIYTEYKFFCRDNNYMAFSNRVFKKHLEGRKFSFHRTTVGHLIYCSKQIK